MQPDKGPGLEARVARHFLAQGLFAEGSLRPAASADYRLIATDIDVLVSEYTSGFHLTRRHAECKGGKTNMLDRVLWTCGVRQLLGADAAYLVLDRSIESEAVEFARKLGVQFLSVRQLEKWENSSGISANVWPGRTRYQVYEPARKKWKGDLQKAKTDDTARSLKTIASFVEIDSWLLFRYRFLNRLFRHLRETGEIAARTADVHTILACRYLASSLLVRLSQYLMAVCHELSSVPETDIREHLTERLTYGDQDPAHVSSLIESTVTWIRRALKGRGADLPGEIDVARLYSSPDYSGEFLELVLKLLDGEDAAIHLPLALEVIQFSVEEGDKRLPKLENAVTKAETLVATLKGFVMRNLGVQGDLLEPVGVDLGKQFGIQKGV